MFHTRSKSTSERRTKVDRTLIPHDADCEAMGLCCDITCFIHNNSFLQKVGQVIKGKNCNLNFRHKHKRNRSEKNGTSIMHLQKALL